MSVECPTLHCFELTLHLAAHNITFSLDNNIMFVSIKGSKTDPFRVSTTIRLGALRGSICPVRDTQQFLTLRSQASPLFIFEDGFYLTRRFVSAFINLALPHVINLDTHSFRIGGASAALSAGASDSLIRILGRWSRDSYLTYLRIPDSHILQFNNLMGNSATVTAYLEPLMNGPWLDNLVYAYSIMFFSIYF